MTETRLHEFLKSVFSMCNHHIYEGAERNDADQTVLIIPVFFKARSDEIVEDKSSI